MLTFFSAARKDNHEGYPYAEKNGCSGTELGARDGELAQKLIRN
jgi:hypothetical protein